MCILFFFLKQKTAYEMRISDWSSDVCSSDLVVRAGRIVRFCAGEALRVYGRNVRSVRVGVEAATRRDPLGVVGLITPWNFPIAIPAWKIAPALAFGNTVVLKAAAITPAIASALGDVLVEAGIPKGVFNHVFVPGADRKSTRLNSSH